MYIGRSFSCSFGFKIEFMDFIFNEKRGVVFFYSFELQQFLEVENTISSVPLPKLIMYSLNCKQKMSLKF